MNLLIAITAAVYSGGYTCGKAEFKKEIVTEWIKPSSVTELKTRRVDCDHSETKYAPYTVCQIFVDGELAYLSLKPCYEVADVVNGSQR